MSRLSNASTLRIGIVRSWNNYWFDKFYYSSVLFNDLKVKDYISGIFYKLKIVSDYIYMHRLLNKNILIKTDLIFFSNIRFKSLTLRNAFKINRDYFFFYKKRYWLSFLLFHRLLKWFEPSDLYARMEIVSTSMSNTLMVFLLHYKSIFFTRTFNFTNLNSSFGTMVISDKVNSKQFGNTNLYNGISVFIDADYLLYFSFYYLFNMNYVPVNIGSSFFENLLLRQWFNSSFYTNFINLIYIYFKYIFYFFISYNKKDNAINLLSYLPNFFFEKEVFKSFHYSSISNIYFFFNVLNRKNISMSLFNSLRYQIENSISMYEQQNVYFYFSLFFKKNPYTISSKMITDMLVYLLESGKKIVYSFFFIRNWQFHLYTTKRQLEHLYYKNRIKYKKDHGINLKYLFQFSSKRAPIIGIRIECSGTFKKGRMSKVYFYSSWIKNDLLTGRMPNTSMIADIDYYQYFVVSKSSTLGIKTWIFLETHLYDNNHKYISIIY